MLRLKFQQMYWFSFRIWLIVQICVFFRFHNYPCAIQSAFRNKWMKMDFRCSLCEPICFRIRAMKINMMFKWVFFIRYIYILSEKPFSFDIWYWILFKWNCIPFCLICAKKKCCYFENSQFHRFQMFLSSEKCVHFKCFEALPTQLPLF